MINSTKYQVICLTDDGNYALVTRRLFDSRDEADKYATNIDSSRKPVVFELFLNKPKEAKMDMKMKWKTAMRYLIEILKHGTEEGRDEAEDELMKLAKYVDELLEVAEK